jgi:deoxyribodipyrimidine photo-lyase
LIRSTYFNVLVNMRPVIVWFRHDLRLADNPALTAAAKTGAPVLCLYILDEKTPGEWGMGGASRWWLHKSLEVLSRRLSEIGGGLVLRRGAAETVLPKLAKAVDAEAVFWNRCYEGTAVERDKRLKDDLPGAESFNGMLLFEPWEVKTGAGTPFKVFTPFWRAARALPEPGRPLPAPKSLKRLTGVESDTLSGWKLLPHKPDWAGGLRAEWMPGEDGAHERLAAFLRGIKGYREGRDRPDRDATSRLSPHLHFGEVSARQIWHAIRHRESTDDGEKFLAELGWREFCHQLLFHHPTLPTKPLDERFAKFPWRDADAAFKRWTKGRTGVPIVDAGMRQLWHTGWMHNRVRMIVASYLIKYLGIDWRRGEAWFWDTLVDADLANNSANWQWVAGCGADAAPFFRIFNPVLQGEKFDKKGDYVRHWVPEIAKLPDKYIHKPWEAPDDIRAAIKDYPEPLVDLQEGRERALTAFRSLPSS